MATSKEVFKNNYKNQEGYSDPTLAEAIKNIEAEARRVDWVLKVIYSVCELAGYKVEGRIVLRDQKTGKVWR